MLGGVNGFLTLAESLPYSGWRNDVTSSFTSHYRLALSISVCNSILPSSFACLSSVSTVGTVRKFAITQHHGVQPSIRSELFEAGRVILPASSPRDGCAHQVTARQSTTSAEACSQPPGTSREIQYDSARPRCGEQFGQPPRLQINGFPKAKWQTRRRQEAQASTAATANLLALPRLQLVAVRLRAWGEHSGQILLPLR